MVASDFAISLFLQPAWVLIGIVVLLCAAITWSVWIVTFRLLDLAGIRTPQAAFHTGVTGLFALFLTFTASDAWRRGDAAYVALLRESSEAAGLIQVIEAVPDTEAAPRHRALLRLYLRASLREEWAEHNAFASQAAGDALDTMRQTALAGVLGPHGALWRLAVDRIEGVAQARIARLVAGGLYGDMLRWAGLMILFAAGVVAMAAAHLNQKRSAPVAMTIYAVGAAIALSIVAANEHPYAGWDGTTSDRLVQLLARIDGPGTPVQ